MKYTFIIFFLITNQIVFSQKMPTDYFEEGGKFFEEKKYDSALTSFQYIVNNHPNNELYPKSFYNVGYIYFSKQDYSKAIDIFNRILKSNFNEKEDLGGGIMDDPYTNYRHRASEILSEIYYDQNKFDSSLYYFILSDETYPYLHFCGNEYASNKIYKALRYADIYQKLNKEDKAIQSLLSAVFITLSNNSEVIDELKKLLSNKQGIKNELDKSLKNIYSKSFENDGNTYTKYFFKFLNTEIQVPDSFGGREKSFDKTKAAKEIKETQFYKMIFKL